MEKQQQPLPEGKGVEYGLCAICGNEYSEPEIVEHTDLVALQDQYIKLLTEEIDSLVGAASVHGWQSQNVAEGERLRELIGYAKSNPSPKGVEGLQWVKVSRVLDILHENRKACANLTPEDTARTAQDIIIETYNDLIDIFANLSPTKNY